MIWRATLALAATLSITGMAPNPIVSPASAQSRADVSGEWQGMQSGDRIALEPSPEGVRVVPVKSNSHDLSQTSFYRWRDEWTFRIDYPGGSSAVFRLEKDNKNEDRLLFSGPSSRPGSWEYFRRLSPAPTARRAPMARPAPVAREAAAASRPKAAAPAAARGKPAPRVQVRHIHLMGTRCVRASVVDLRPGTETGPLAEPWDANYVLTNQCAQPQWVRIEVDGGSYYWQGGLWTPGARMQPSLAKMPKFPWGRPILERDFNLKYRVPANGHHAWRGPVGRLLIEKGLDVWIASCDARGPLEQQALYLSKGFAYNPIAVCYNHALPGGGLTTSNGPARP